MSKNYVRLNGRLLIDSGKLVEMPDVNDIAGTVDEQTEALATLSSTVNDFSYIVHNDTTGDDSTISGTTPSGNDLNILLTGENGEILQEQDHTKLCVLSSNNNVALDKIKVDIVPKLADEMVLEAIAETDGSSHIQCYVDGLIYFFKYESASDRYMLFTFNPVTKEVINTAIGTDSEYNVVNCVAQDKVIYILTYILYSSSRYYSYFYKLDTTTMIMSKINVAIDGALRSVQPLIYNNKIYTIGTDGNETTRVVEYDINAQTITYKSISKGYANNATILYNGNIYIFGGKRYNNGWENPFNYVDVYNIDSNTIASLSVQAPFVSSGFQYAFLFKEEIYLFDYKDKNLYKFITTSNTFEIVENYPTCPYSQYTVSVTDNEVYMMFNDKTNIYKLYQLSSTLPLEANTLLISKNEESEYSFNVINSQTVDFKCKLDKVYIGNSENAAELINAYVYVEGNGWTNVNTGVVLTA